MRLRFLSLLRCPGCRARLALARSGLQEGDDLIEGELACTACSRSYPVRKGIPCFVQGEDYAASFGWQWTRFAHLQRDSYNGTGLVRDSILRRTGWTPEFLAGKTLLECGCGSGNDTEVLADLCGTVVSLDLSSAVESQSPEVLKRENVLVVRADLRAAPFEEQTFDLGYCHRVIQHTPDPRAAFAGMARFVRPGGSFFLHSYDTHWKSMRHFKYWVRPLIKGWPHERVFKTLKVAGPVLYPLVGALNRIGGLRRLVKLALPFENHDRILSKAGCTLTRRERYEYSLLVTFDDLTPEYDNPNPPEVLAEWFEEQGFIDVEILGRRPSLVVGVRPADKTLPRPRAPWEAPAARAPSTA